MKNFLYITIVAVVIGSCTNIKKLVEQGRYEEALDHAMNKMAGEKNKKTKYVIALEDAYKRLVDKDLEQIAYLKSQDRPEVYTKVHNLYLGMQDRQNRIKPFLPLVSEEGYAAHFVMNDYNQELKEASDIAAEHHYNQGKLKLAEAQRTGDRLSARAAFYAFKNVEDFYRTYKDKDSLKAVANDLGITRVLIEAVNESNTSLPNNLQYELLHIQKNSYDSRWVQYYEEQPQGTPIDYKALILLKDIHVSPEQVYVNTHHDQKEVVEGTKTVFETVTETDTSGVVTTKQISTQVENLIIVHATTTETTLDKNAVVAGQVVLIDMLTGEDFEVEDMNGNYVFHSECVDHSGDDRARCDSAVHGWSTSCDNFPSDEKMLIVSTEAIKDQAHKLITSSFE